MRDPRNSKKQLSAEDGDGNEGGCECGCGYACACGGGVMLHRQIDSSVNDGKPWPKTKLKLKFTENETCSKDASSCWMAPGNWHMTRRIRVTEDDASQTKK